MQRLNDISNEKNTNWGKNVSAAAAVEEELLEGGEG